MSEPTTITLPQRARRSVLAFGAFLKNTICLLEDGAAHLSPIHGDLASPEACAALHESAEALVASASRRIEAVAHDLHPDFESTRLALAWAERLQVPAVAVQHHHAHVGVVQAERGSCQDVVALALDGVGLGSDGTAWGGELLEVRRDGFARLGGLTQLRLPGGDVAAREPWRMAAAALYALGRADEIGSRLSKAVSEAHANTLRTMLERHMNSPVTSSAGRWFDAVAGLLGVSVRQSFEAEAAIALEKLATGYLAERPALSWEPSGLELLPLISEVLAIYDRDGNAARPRAAALFHLGLARGLAQALATAAQARALGDVVISGGCLLNRVLSTELRSQLEAHGLRVHQPTLVSCGDAGLALGQAWVVANQEDLPCA